MTSLHRSLAALAPIALTLTVAACGSSDAASPSSAFLHGQVATVVNSTGRALTLFQLANPTKTQQLAFGASEAITATGANIRGTKVIVPLGDAASVAYVDLSKLAVTRYYLFASGNATGSAFVDDTTILAANTVNNTVGRMTAGQTSDSISDTVKVSLGPTDIEVSGTFAYVVSSRLDPNNNYLPVGNGVVSKIDLATMQVVDTVLLSTTNPVAGAFGPDGKLYVIDAVDYVNPGVLDVIDPTTMTLMSTVANVGVGPSGLHIDAGGLAYISDYYTGTVIYNVLTASFVRGPANPLCAPYTNHPCRGALDARPDAAGNVYQVFFGTDSIPGQVFIYSSGTYTLKDSVVAGTGPTSLLINSF